MNPLASLIKALSDKESGRIGLLLEKEWAEKYAKPEFIAFNRLLIDLGLRGLGILNYQNDEISGQSWFLEHWAGSLGPATPMVLDVGANQGDYVQAIARVRPDAAIHAFEPGPTSFAALQKITAGNARHHAHNLALSNEPGELPLYDYDHSKDATIGTAHASLFAEVFSKQWQRPATATMVQVETLDAFCEAHAIPHIDLLKIDTEGAELKVLQGARRLITENRIGVIHLEFNQMNVISKSFFQDFVALLPHHQFGRLLPKAILPLDPGDYLFTNFFQFQNLVALPKQS